MKAISIVPHEKNVSLTDISEPRIISARDIKLKVIEVGICGTDREEVTGGRADAPAGRQQLIIGHEMFGQVIQTGSEVHDYKFGDYGLFTVRRGCNQCPACLNNRSDMCYTGNYTERGIKGADGFQAQFVVDREQYFVQVPESCKNIGVLTEPMSVAEKAIDEAVTIQQARLKGIAEAENWLKGKRALVAGLGPIGLMTVFALRLKGAEVTGLDIVDEMSLRVQILKNLQGNYIDGRNVQTLEIDKKFGEFDFVFEATGIAKLQIQLIDTLANNGIYVATGIAEGQRPLPVNVGQIMQQMVLKNQILLGSVNASVKHYKMAVDSLQQSQKYWPGLIEKVITNRYSYTDYRDALFSNGENEIKSVVFWD